MNKRRDVSEQAKRAIVAFRSHCRSSEVNLLLHSVARCLLSSVGHAGIRLGRAGSRALGHQSRSLDLEDGWVECSQCQQDSCGMPKTPLA